MLYSPDTYPKRKKGGVRNICITSVLKMKDIFWNCNGFKDAKKHRFISV
jgi:hypothetical protein